MSYSLSVKNLGFFPHFLSDIDLTNFTWAFPSSAPKDSLSASSTGKEKEKHKLKNGKKNFFEKDKLKFP